MKFLRYLSWRRSSRRINNWLVRRQWKLFKFALPAILASLLLVVVLGVVLFIHRQSDAIHQRYHRLALIALSGKQYEVARVACLRGIAESRTINERLEWTYYLAVCFEWIGANYGCSSSGKHRRPAGSSRLCGGTFGGGTGVVEQY